MLLLNESIRFYNMLLIVMGSKVNLIHCDLCNIDFNKIKSLGNSSLLSLTDRNVYNSAQQEM